MQTYLRGILNGRKSVFAFSEISKPEQTPRHYQKPIRTDGQDFSKAGVMMTSPHFDSAHYAQEKMSENLTMILPPFASYDYAIYDPKQRRMPMIFFRCKIK